MDLDNIKQHLTEYVDSITEHTKKGNRKAYNCPICNSGYGSNGTGAFTINTKKPTTWKCFACGNGGDIFNLIGLVRNLDTFNEQLKYACDIFNIDFNSNDIEHSKKEFKKDNFKNAMKVTNETDNKIENETESKTENETENKVNYTSYFDECKKQLAEFLKDKKEYRGISLETLKKFDIGYDKQTKSIVIPTTDYSYSLRSITGKRIQKVTASNPINLKCLSQDLDVPIFVVEGEIDALCVLVISYIGFFKSF